MSNLRAVCRPDTVFSSIVCCSRTQSRSRFRVSISKNVGFRTRVSNSSPSSSWFRYKDSNLWFRLNQRNILATASKWSEEKSPYDTLELDRDAEEEQSKVAYRRLAKFYHSNVYDGKGALEEGETAEARFIKIQAAYELLMDSEKKIQYDMGYI